MSPLKPTTLRVAALTHVGKRRHSNEDCIAVASRIRSESMAAPSVHELSLEVACVCMVADGMGGHPAGDVASRLAIEYLSAELTHPEIDDQTLISAVRRANRALYDEMKRTPEVIGMGTTIAGLAASRAGIAAFNVGDSRIYRVHNGELEQLSTDDSEQIFTSFMAMEIPTRALSSCLGGFAAFEEITPHIVRESAQESVQYLICSDGLHDMLSDQAIAACLSADLDFSVRLLFERAMDEGGIDNISIILARFEFDAPSTGRARRK